MSTYDFAKFTVNGVDTTSNPVQLVMLSNQTVVAHYTVESKLGTVTFNGTVSGQARALGPKGVR